MVIGLFLAASVFLWINAEAFVEDRIILSGLHELPEYGDSYNLTCTVNRAVNLSIFVAFKQNTSRTKTRFGVLEQDHDQCTVLDKTPGYVPSCGAGTDKASSPTKRYRLMVQRMKLSDKKPWYCKIYMQSGGIESHRWIIHDHADMAADMSRSTSAVAPVLMSVGLCVIFIS